MKIRVKTLSEMLEEGLEIFSDVCKLRAKEHDGYFSASDCEVMGKVLSAARDYGRYYRGDDYMIAKWAAVVVEDDPVELTVAEIAKRLNIKNLKIIEG